MPEPRDPERDAPARRSRTRHLRRLPAVVGALVLLLLVDLGIGALWPYPFGRDPGGIRPRVSPTLWTYRGEVDRLRELRLTFAPSARVHALHLLFGLDAELVEDDFHSLTLSSIASVPSTAQPFVDGRPGPLAILDGVDAGFERSTFRLAFEERGLALEQDGRSVGLVEGLRPVGPIRIALYPSWPMAYLRPDYEVLRSVEVVERGGERRRHGPPWVGHALRPWLLAAVGGIEAFGLRHRRIQRAFASLLALALGVPLAALVGALVLGGGGGPGVGRAIPFLDDPTATGGAEAAGLTEVELVLAQRGFELDPDPAAIRILAFGGSTTAGDPYDREGDHYDYPAELQRMLAASPAYDDVPVEVVNLGRVGIPVAEITRRMPPFLDAIEPRVVVLSSVYNNAFADGFELLEQVLGGRRAPGPPPERLLAEYEHGLRCIARLTRSRGAVPLWVEEFVDVRHFDGRDVLGPFQETLARVADEEGIDLVRLQELADAEPNRLLFYEFIHPTSLGYRWMAGQVLAWFEDHAELVRSGPTPADIPPGALDACGPAT